MPSTSPWPWAKATRASSLNVPDGRSLEAPGSWSGRLFTILQPVAQAPHPIQRVVSTRIDLLIFSTSPRSGGVDKMPVTKVRPIEFVCTRYAEKFISSAAQRALKSELLAPELHQPETVVKLRNRGPRQEILPMDTGLESVLQTRLFSGNHLIPCADYRRPHRNPMCR